LQRYVEAGGMVSAPDSRFDPQRPQCKPPLLVGDAVQSGGDLAAPCFQIREAQGERPELQGDRPHAADQVGDRLAGALVGNPEVPSQRIADVAHVLLPERLVEPVGAQDIGFRRWRQGHALCVIRTAGDEVHEEKGHHGDNH
jgi:hypothetical protein